MRGSTNDATFVNGRKGRTTNLIVFVNEEVQ
jgi:hypothetical protein